MVEYHDVDEESKTSKIEDKKYSKIHYIVKQGNINVMTLLVYGNLRGLLIFVGGVIGEVSVLHIRRQSSKATWN